MKSLKGLVFRYIWKNKLRTLMTILGVTISAFIIFGIFSFGLNVHYNRMLNYYRLQGSYDASYNVSKETAAELLKQKNGEPSNISDDGCSIKKLYVSVYKKGIIYVDDMKFFKGLDLKYGRYPENENEIIASQHILGNTDYFITPNAQVGRKIVIADKAAGDESGNDSKNDSGDDSKDDSGDDSGNDSGEKRQMLLTGVFDGSEEIVFDGAAMPKDFVRRMAELVTLDEDDDDYRYYYVGNMMISKLNLEKLDAKYFRVLVSFDEKKDIEEQAALLGERLGSEAEVNFAAVDLYEPEKSESGYEELFFEAFLMLIAGVFGLVAMVITRNAFNISVSERENDYGMFRCIGLTRKQIIKMILLEALIVGVIGTLIGVLLGALGCSGLFSYLNRSGSNNLILKEILNEIGKLTFYFNWKALGLTVLFMAVIVAYSMVSPIEKLCRLNPINALKSRDDVDKRVTKKLLKKKKKCRTGKGLLGYPVSYGFKNVRIRRSRFYLLVISLSVCFGIVMLVGCIFETMIKTELNNQNKPSITIYGNSGDERFSYSEIDTFRDMFSKKKGFVDIGYSIEVGYFEMKDASEEVLKRNCGNVEFVGLNEKYYKAVSDAAGTPDNSAEAGVINAILVKGNIKDKDYIPELKTGDDITIYDAKVHIAGEISIGVFENIRTEKLPDTLFYRKKGLTFFYLRDFEEPVISKNQMEKDSDNILYHEETANLYIYIDAEKDDGSILSAVSEMGCYYESNGINYDGMRMIKRIVYFIVAIVLAIIAVNLVNVRTSEILLRRKEIRLLRSIGFSIREVRRAVISEGILVALCSVITGFLIGVGAARLMSKILYVGKGITGLYNSDYMSIRFGIDWGVFAATAVVIFVINIVAGLIALALVRDDYK